LICDQAIHHSKTSPSHDWVLISNAEIYNPQSHVLPPCCPWPLHSLPAAVAIAQAQASAAATSATLNHAPKAHVPDIGGKLCLMHQDVPRHV
jgi:hypothetical protein